MTVSKYKNYLEYNRNIIDLGGGRREISSISICGNDVVHELTADKIPLLAKMTLKYHKFCEILKENENNLFRSNAARNESPQI